MDNNEKLKRLEKILKVFCNKPFKNSGKLTKSGANAYEILCEILYDLEKLGIVDSEDTIETLDVIINQYPND